MLSVKNSTNGYFPEEGNAENIIMLNENVAPHEPKKYNAYCKKISGKKRISPKGKGKNLPFVFEHCALKALCAAVECVMEENNNSGVTFYGPSGEAVVVDGKALQSIIHQNTSHQAPQQVTWLWRAAGMDYSVEEARRKDSEDDSRLIGIIVHLPTGRGGHFVFLDCRRHPPRDHAEYNTSLWQMRFYAVKNHASDGTPTFHCTVYFPSTYTGGEIAPFGMGNKVGGHEGGGGGNKTDWIFTVSDVVGTGGEISGMHFYKGGQFIPGGGRAPKGGTWTQSPRFGFKHAGKLMNGAKCVAAVGTVCSAVQSYNENVRNDHARPALAAGLTTGGSYLAGVAGGIAFTAATGGTGPVIVAAAAGAGMVSSFVFDRFVAPFITRACDKPRKDGAGIGDDDEGPGGVDLRRIPRLNSFCDDSALFTGKGVLHLFFPLQVPWDTIAHFLQEKLSVKLPPHQVPWMILQEVARCRAFGVPIYFSLHFQRKDECASSNADMYSVMPPMLRTMIIGHVIALLDVFLKGYVNGGTYSETFILGYEGLAKSGVDGDFVAQVVDLNRELVLHKKELQKAGKSVDHLPNRYINLRDLIDEEMGEESDADVNEKYFANNYYSAFRILGTVQKVRRASGNILEPVGGVEVESDVNVKPPLAAALCHTLRNGKEGPKEHTAYVSAHNKMRAEVKKNMTRYPRFAPYFELLKFISFSVALVDGLCDAGVHPKDLLSSESVVANLPPFPVTLPPLPIRESRKVSLNVTMRDTISYVSEQSEQDKELLNCMVKNDDSVLKKYTPQYRSEWLSQQTRATLDLKLRSKCGVSEEEIELLDDGSLKVSEAASTFRNYLIFSVCATALLHISMNANKSGFPVDGDAVRQLLDTVTHQKVVEYLSSLLEQDITSIIRLAASTARGSVERRVREHFNNRIDSNIRDFERRTPIFARDELRSRLLSENEYSIQESIRGTQAGIYRREAEALEQVQKGAQLVKEDLHFFKKDPIGFFLATHSDSITDIPITKGHINVGNTRPSSSTDVVLGVVGGCGLKASTVLIQNSSEVAKRHESFCSTSVLQKGGTRLKDATQPYYQLDVPLVPFLGDNSTLQHFCTEGISGDGQALYRCLVALHGDSARIKDDEADDPFGFDSYGRHAGHYVGCVPTSKPEKLLGALPTSLVNTPGQDGEMPLHTACAVGHYEAVVALLGAGADPLVVLPSKLHPLLIACQNNFRSIAIHLLKSGCGSLVNCCTDTEETALHWSVKHRDLPLTAELIQHGAVLHPRRSDSATPIHIAARIGALDVLSFLMTSFPNSLTTTTQDGRNVLHHACAGNNRECAKCLVAAMGISGLCVEDKQLLTPLTLSVHLGHTNLAVEMCRTADVSNLAQLVSGLQSGAASRMTTVITENAGLAAYFEITRAKEEETKSNSHAAPEYSMKSFSKEAVEKPKATETLLPKCLEYRSAQAFTNLALYGTLTPEQVKEVLVGVATLGLHDWPPALSHCGIDLSVENIDGEGHDLLELTAQKGDDVLFRAVWKEYLQTTPKATHCHRLVRALCCVPSLRRCPAELLLAFGLALHELDGGLPPGAADPLLQSTGTSTALWAFATNQGLQPSRKGVIAAAAFCRPAVLQFVLSGGAGLDEDVRLGMLEKALESERKDNALVIVQHCWPDFAVRAREPKNTSLAQKMDAKVKSTKLKQFQADADAQEEVLNNPVLLQEVYQTDADNFFRKLLDRQMLPLKDGSFGVFSWLNARYADTARVKLPSYWNLETEDERGESGFGCLWGSVIRNPSKAPLIAASIGIELETLLCHFSFESVALKRSADPCSTVEDILKSCATDRAVAACVSGLCGAENISVSKWNAVLKFPNVETAVPTMVDAVVNEEDQVTLLMRLLPVPEATNLLDLALSSKSIVRALQKCDRLGRSPAHHLLEKRDAAEESTPEMTEAVHAILTDRLRKIVALLPSLLHKQDRFGHTLFMLAAKANNVSALAFLTTLASPQVLNRPFTTEGFCAVHLGAEADAVEAVELLVSECGVNPNVKTEITTDSSRMDAIGLTPLHLAAKGNHARLFRGLLKLGGDPLFRNSKGESPIHWALEHGNDEMYKVVQDLPGFWLLSGQGELIGPMSRNEQLDDFYRCFLLQCTHPNRALRGWTKMNAFLEAVRTGNIPAVHQLALSGADLVSSDDEKWNAVHFACHFGHTAILAHIIRYVTLFYPKKMLEQLLVQSADTGNTPIHFAATKGNVGCVEILLTYPCVREQCVQARNNNGLIPANAAALSGHDDLAILLDEATGAKGRPEARDDSDKAYLEAFWGSVTEGTRRRAAEKLQELTTDQGNESEAETPDVYVGFSQVSEESWDSQVERSIEAYLSFLPESVRPHFSAHPVLSSRVVLPFVVTNLLNIPDGAGMRAELQSTLAAVCTLDGSNGVPIFAQRFFVENILLFEPTENWSSILYSLSLTATLWSAEQYPPESHCLWEWLRLFFSKRNLGEEMAAHTYEALDTFLAFLGEDRVQLLPVPEISIGSKEVPYENNLSEALRSVNQWLREVEGSDSDLRCAIRHLNLLWRHRDVLSSQQKGDHWSIEENKAVSHYKVRILSSLNYLNCDEVIIPTEVRSFILSTVNAVANFAIPATTEAVLLGWTSSAAMCTAQVGLAQTARVLQKIKTQLQQYCPSSKKDAWLFPDSMQSPLSFLTKVVRSFMEMQSEVTIMQCVGVAADTPELYVGAVEKALQTTITKLRAKRLGEDRPVEELIAAFGTSPAAGATFQPHLFAFDGTPTVALFASHREALRVIVDSVESVDVSTLSTSTLQRTAKQLGVALHQRPTLQGLGCLIAHIREAAYRALDKRPFRVQYLCVAAFFLPLCLEEPWVYKGRLAQMATGEGKTIVVAMTAAMYALMDQVVDVITSSGPLAARDAREMSSFFQHLGLRVSHIAVKLPTRHHFNAEVVYGTNTDFEFAELRELCYLQPTRQQDLGNTNSWVPRPKAVAIVDEADNLFLDASRNSARIAGSTGESFTWVYRPLFQLVQQSGVVSVDTARRLLSSMEGGSYATLTATLSDRQIQRWVLSAHHALDNRKKNIHYIVRQDKVVIVDLDTGRLQVDSRWDDGIHEMVEVKENVPVNPEGGTVGAVSHPSFFDQYRTVIGITGTAGETREREEILQLYGVDTFDVPPHRPCLRRRLPTLLFRTEAKKFAAMARSAVEKRQRTSVLILVPTIAETEKMADAIAAVNPHVPCYLFNETQKESEDFILLKASQVGTIVVATNTAGRGTDIRPSAEVLNNGGLHVLYGGFPSNLRVECQALGRSGRQGQPGTSEIYISLDEPFVRELLKDKHVTEEEMTSAGMVEKLYRLRSEQITKDSNSRVRATALERARYACLQYFSKDYTWLAKELLVLKNTTTVGAMKAALQANEFASLRPFSVEDLCVRITYCFHLQWICFFTEVGREDDDDEDDQEIVQLHQNKKVKERAMNLYERFLHSKQWQLTRFRREDDEDMEEGYSLDYLTKQLSAIFSTYGPVLTHLEVKPTD